MTLITPDMIMFMYHDHMKIIDTDKNLYNIDINRSKGHRDMVFITRNDIRKYTNSVICLTPALLEITDFWLLNPEEDPEYFI